MVYTRVLNTDMDYIYTVPKQLEHIAFFASVEIFANKFYFNVESIYLNLNSLHNQIH